jgi:serine/threonine protein kinase/Tol biopolymer transport system component
VPSTRIRPDVGAQRCGAALGIIVVWTQNVPGWRTKSRGRAPGFLRLVSCMDAPRWHRIEEIYHEALDLPAEARAEFLERGCAGDRDLREEVEELLRKDSESHAVLDGHAWEHAVNMLASHEVAPDSLFGPYRVIRQLGSGGMGTVYLAADTRLQRNIALKVLRTSGSAPNVGDRLRREARLVSSLNHPHICALYDIGLQEGVTFLVMEYVKGETLGNRLRRGRMPIDLVLRTGAQIADALSAAHAKGIVHRDLKPENIMLNGAGVKVLDFGVAKFARDTPLAAAEETLTATGMIVGTPAYMSPEQLNGRDCDPRTDLFALGLLLYEMASGRRAFAHATQASLVAAILTAEPDYVALQHPHLEAIIRGCLEKEPTVRWQNAQDIKRMLEWRSSGWSDPPLAQPAPRKGSAVWRRALGAALVVLSLAVGLALGHQWRPAANRRAVHLSLTAPAGTELTQGSAISPDGEQLAFVARAGGREKIWLRRLNFPTARELPGTDGGALPFWSPDSASLGFFVDGKLKRIDVASGVTSVICEVGKGRGASWNSEGTILFNSVNDGPLLRVAASGGEPAAVTTVDRARGENSHRWPYFLPGGRKFLYFVRSDNAADRGIYLGSLDQPHDKTQLVRSLGNGIYAPASDGNGGYLLWVRDGILMAQPMDPESGRLRGQPVGLADRVGVTGAYQSTEISASKDSGLVYRGAEHSLLQMTWYNRQGQPSGILGEPGAYTDLRISPDGLRILLRRDVTGSEYSAYHMMELSRATVPARLGSPVGMAWSPEGLRIAYDRLAPPNIYLRSLNGSLPEERLTHSTSTQVVTDWSRDGRFLLYIEDSNEIGAKSRADVWAFSLQEHKPMQITSTPFREVRARFSPTGKWIGFSSDESGQREVFVESFPPQGYKWQVSRNGGDHPRWRADGKELFYVSPDSTLMSVKVEVSGNTPVFGTPAALFKIAIPAESGSGTAYTPYDVAAEGRILALAHAGGPAVPSLTVVLGWDAQLRPQQPVTVGQ